VGAAPRHDTGGGGGAVHGARRSGVGAVLVALGEDAGLDHAAVRSTPTTSVTALDGTTLAAEPAATGLLVATPASDLPIVAIALDHVVAT
jgi:hypothetical protein